MPPPDLLGFVREMVPTDTPHSGSDLLSHLTGTYRLLASWGEPPHVCRAGLFHSIYGTASFDRAPLAVDDRQLMVRRIGRRAERLVFLFCAKPADFFSHLRPGPDGGARFPSRFDNEELTASRVELQHLLSIHVANALEQIPRLSADYKERLRDMLLRHESSISRRRRTIIMGTTNRILAPAGRPE